MRGRKKLLGIAVLLSVLLIIPLAFSLGIVDVPQFSLFSTPTQVESASSTASGFVDPAKNITDYWDQPGGAPYGGHNVTIGSTVTFHVNISDVTDLFSWQVNMSWDPSILNVSNIIAGEFLARADEPTSSEELGFMINSTGYAQGYATIAESILGDVAGIPGPESGRLVAIEFEIVGYGCIDLTISTSGTLPTTLLNSTGDSLTFTTTIGYFRNKLQGDVDANTVVDGADISVVIYHRDAGGPGGYDRNVDIDDNTAIDGADISLVIFNRGRHTNFPN